MTEKRVLIIGSSNMDLSLNVYKVPEAGQTVIDDGGVAYTPGGKGANAAVAAGSMGIGAVAALAFLMFNLFTPPCFAAIGAMNSELKSRKWLWGGIGLQFGVGYSVGFLVYFFGGLFTGAGFGEAIWMPIVGWSVVGVFAAVLAVLIIRRNKQIKAELLAKAEKKAVNV